MAAIAIPAGLMAQYNASVHVDQTVNACTSYTWAVNGETYTESGIHTAVIGDTLFILDLSIHQTYTVTVPETVQGGCSYVWGDTTLTEDGQYTRKFQSVDGCDSTVTITLSISGQAVKGYTVTACESYTWKDSTLTESTVWLKEETVGSCDSLLTLYLTVLQPEQKTYDTLVSVCNYVYFRFHPLQAPIRIDRDSILNSDATGFPLTNATARGVFHPRTVQKCFDSVVLAHINIKHSSIEDLVFTGCDSYTFSNDDTTIVYTYTKNDSLYWGKAVNGCDSAYKIAVTIKKSPNVFINGDLRIQSGTAAVLSAYSDQTVTYTWSYDGSHGETLTTAPLTTNTDISLAGYNVSTSCSDTVRVTILVTTEGIDNAESNMLTIYPNPTSNIVNINAEKAVSTVSVYNLNGQKILTTSNSNTVDLSSISKGSYIIRIELEDGSVATSTIVKK